jgi:hypothetical protein
MNQFDFNLQHKKIATLTHFLAS